MVPIATSIPEPIVRENVARLVELLREDDLTAALLFHPSNMLAFAGTPHAAWDRLTCGAVTREGAVLVLCPAFERPAVAGAEPLASIHTWQEDEDPYACFATALRSAGVSSGRLGVDGRTWVDAWRAFEQACPDLALVNGERLLREVRICKSALAQNALQAAHLRGEELFLVLAELIRPDVSERELQAELQAHFDSDGDGLHVNPMIQSGPNGAIPHNPTGDRLLRPGDNVVVDSVTQTDGFNNDLTRTYAIGSPSQRARDAYRAAREARQAAIDATRPGVACSAVDKAAREIIEKAGFGEFFTHRLGHGLGIECHEPPYLNGANAELLRPGMCVTIEPGVYVPGEFGVRIEDDVIVTDTGCTVIRGQLETDVTSAFDE